MSTLLGTGIPIMSLDDDNHQEFTQTTTSTWVETSTKKIFKDASGTQPLSTTPGNKATIHLTIAKNGVDFFQVIVTAGDYPLTSISVTASELTTDGGQTIAATNVQLYLEYYVNVRSNTYYESILDYQLGDYPDALVPLKTSFDVAANTNQPIWVEVNIPDDARPGNYTGTISFSGGLDESITYTIEVLDFSVPSHTGLYNPGYADFWQLNFDDSLTPQQYSDLIQTYTEFFTERDINLGRTYDPIDVPMQDGSGSWDFDPWLEGMLPLLNGGILESFSPLVLLVPIELEILGYTPDTAASTQARSDYKEFLRQFHDYITTQSLIDLNSVQWLVMIGEFDEPNSALLSELIALYYNLTQEVNTELSPFKYYYEVDGSIDWDSSAVQHFFNEDFSGWTRLGDRFDYWMAPQEDFEFDLAFIRDHVASGQEILIYEQSWTAIPKDDSDIPPGFANRDYEFPSLAGIVNPALFHRILPWFAWKYKASGIGFWAVMYWYDDVNGTLLDVWVDDPANWIYFRTIDHIQNGDGWFVYPGDKVNEHAGQPDVNGPVSSLRLELFRKGLEDYKYLQLVENNLNNFDSTSQMQARSLLDSAKELLNTISSFDRDASKYDDLLTKIKALLTGKTLTTSTSSSSQQTSLSGGVETQEDTVSTSWELGISVLVLSVLAIIVWKKREFHR